MAALADNLLLAPEGSFYRRHSPRHELPLAVAISIFAHGFVVGLLILVVVFSFFRANSEVLRPPTMDAIMVEGGLGDGAGGFGLAAGLSGEPRTEVAQLNAKDNLKDTTTTTNKIPPPPEQESLFSPVLSSTDPTAVFKDLESITNEVEKDLKKPEPDKKNPKTGTIKMPGQGGQGGDGRGGTGIGGSGKKVGIKGRSLTKQEVFAYRWRFNLAGTPKEHADKMVAVGFIVVVKDARANYYFLHDLKRRPVELKRDNLGALKDAVKWWNQNQDSVQKLAHELRLPFEPSELIMFLPKDREDKMAAEEARFARSEGRDPQQVRETWFDFVLQDGVYEPKAIKQN